MLDAQAPVEVFCSYADQDEHWRQKLDTHLSTLVRLGLISIWSNCQIIGGNDRRHEIETHLKRASVILLLISPDFLASDFCYSIEMQLALERHQAGEARVIPILVRPVDWKDAPFAHLQALPANARFITLWDNQDAGFAEVAADIRRTIGDLSLLSANLPQSNFPSIWNVPFARNPFFTGREDLLARLHSQFQTGQISASSQPQAVSGLGGIGKTQLAVEYAYRFRQEYKAVFWSLADSVETLTSSYLTIAELLNLPEQNAQKQTITIQAVKKWLQTHKEWLLILDNADEPDALAPFLPPVAGGHLLFTTRATALRRLGVARPIEIETFGVEQGALFLLNRSGLLALEITLEQATSADQELAMQISQELGGLPLALDQAGAYLEATGSSLVAYQQLYQHHRIQLLTERRGQEYDHPEPVAATWDLSFQRVEEKNPIAADLLRFCAFLAADAIPEEIFLQGVCTLDIPLVSIAADAYQLDQAIEVLRAYALIVRNPVTTTLTVHRLVQEVVRATLPKEKQYEWMQWVVLAINATFPDTNVENWLECERLLSHALLCVKWIEEANISDPKTAFLLGRTASYLRKRAHYKEAEVLLKQALPIHERLLGPEHPSTADNLNNLALLYFTQARYEEAEPLYQRALAICERILGPEHLSTAHSLNNLSGLYYRQGKHQEAISLLQRALGIYEGILGPEHPELATSLNNLAGFYYRQGKYEEAKPLYQRALAISEHIPERIYPETSSSLLGLALLHQTYGNYKEAEPLYRRALTICEQAVGLKHPDTADILYSLARLYQTQRKDDEASSLYKRALAIYEQTLGPEHHRTQTIRADYQTLSHNESKKR